MLYGLTIIHDCSHPPRCSAEGVLPVGPLSVCADKYSPFHADNEDTPLRRKGGGMEGGREGMREGGREGRKEGGGD